MVSISERTGVATAREDRARQVLEDTDRHFADVRDRLAEADRTGREILPQVFTDNGQPMARVFLPGSIPSNVADRIGLENAWTTEDRSTGYGYCDVSKEGLADVQHADVFYQAQPDDDPVQDKWSHDPVWNSYEFVTEDRVYTLGAKTWMFGGPLVSQRIANRIVDPLLA
jgi:iron complex transport system substrate-binding protein